MSIVIKVLLSGLFFVFLLWTVIFIYMHAKNLGER